MKIFTNQSTWTIATLQKIGSMFLVTIGNIRKIFDRLATAENYIVSMGYQL